MGQVGQRLCRAEHPDCHSIAATAGTDYEAPSQQLLTFPAGTSTGVMSCVDVSITDDSAVEGDETFTVSLTSSSPIVTLGNDQVTITITDNDRKEN